MWKPHSAKFPTVPHAARRTASQRPSARTRRAEASLSLPSPRGVLIRTLGLLSLFAFLPLGAQTTPGSARPASGKPQLPALEPGEGLAVAGPDRRIQLFGEARQEAPMGSLAKLVWIRLEGTEWIAQGLLFKCTGHMGPWTCWNPKGHGRVDLSKALEESCNLAFLAWIQEARGRWAQTLGTDVGRFHLEQGFKPFLGNRLDQEPGLPPLGPEWVGDGILLRTTPEAFLQWLLDPAQEELMPRLRDLMLGFRQTFLDGIWWVKSGTAPVPGDFGATSAWVAGSNGTLTAVLHLPRGRGKAEGMARFKALMGLQDKPQKK